MRAIARARPWTVVAKFGAEQPSMPQPGAGASHISSKAVRTARCTGWSTSTYSVPPPSRAFSVRKPACLPEQLLWSWLGRRSSSRRRWRSAASSGTCGPQRRSGSARPMASSQAATRVTCISAPECEAQASASCSPVSASPAPLSRSGSACSILQDERGRITASGSPQAARIVPRASQTTACPRWCDSATSPRQTSTIVTGSRILTPPRQCRRPVCRTAGGRRDGSAT